MCMCMSMIMVILSKKSVSHDHVLVAVQQPPPALKRKSRKHICVVGLCVYDSTNRSKSSWQAVSCSELTRRDLLLMMREGGWECPALLRSGWVLDPHPCYLLIYTPLPPRMPTNMYAPLSRVIFSNTWRTHPCPVVCFLTPGVRPPVTCYVF